MLCMIFFRRIPAERHSDKHGFVAMPIFLQFLAVRASGKVFLRRHAGRGTQLLRTAILMTEGARRRDPNSFQVLSCAGDPPLPFVASQADSYRRSPSLLQWREDQGGRTKPVKSIHDDQLRKLPRRQLSLRKTFAFARGMAASERRRIAIRIVIQRKIQTGEAALAKFKFSIVRNPARAVVSPRWFSWYRCIRLRSSATYASPSESWRSTWRDHQANGSFRVAKTPHHYASHCRLRRVRRLQ